MIAYHLIQIAEHLQLAVNRILGPTVCHPHLSDHIKNEARSLINKADLLSQRTADHPDLDTLHTELNEIRAALEHFMAMVVSERLP